MGICEHICHQRPDRSFSFKGRQIPLCARCLFLYSFMALGIALGLLLSFESFALSNPFLTILVLILLPGIGAVEWGLQEQTAYESTNPRRAVTGAMAGFSGGLALSLVISYFI